jgi:hypothetical protein
MQEPMGYNFGQMAIQVTHVISEILRRWTRICLRVLGAYFNALKIRMNMHQVISHARKGSKQRLHDADLLLDNSLLTASSNNGRHV